MKDLVAQSALLVRLESRNMRMIVLNIAIRKVRIKAKTEYSFPACMTTYLGRNPAEVEVGSFSQLVRILGGKHKLNPIVCLQAEDLASLLHG